MCCPQEEHPGGVLRDQQPADGGGGPGPPGDLGRRPADRPAGRVPAVHRRLQVSKGAAPPHGSPPRPNTQSVLWLSVLLSVCMSVRSSVCLTVCLSVHQSFRLSVRPSVYLSISISVCLTVCPSVRLPVCLTIWPSVRPSVHQSICLSVCPSISDRLCQSVCPFVCLPDSLFVRPSHHHHHRSPESPEASVDFDTSLLEETDNLPANDILWNTLTADSLQAM